MEKREIAEVIGGGALTAIADIGIETVWASNKEYWSGKFPFIPLEPLPPLDDMLIMAVPGVVAFLAHRAKRNTIRNVALGGFAYGLGMVLRHTIIRLSPYTYLGTATKFR
jgi:hypothetical protein